MWEVLERNWELILGVCGAVWGIVGSIGKRLADRRFQRFLKAHFSLIERYEKAEIALLKKMQASDAWLPKEL